MRTDINKMDIIYVFISNHWWLFKDVFEITERKKNHMTIRPVDPDLVHMHNLTIETSLHKHPTVLLSSNIYSSSRSCMHTIAAGEAIIYIVSPA